MHLNPSSKCMNALWKQILQIYVSSSDFRYFVYSKQRRLSFENVIDLNKVVICINLYFNDKKNRKHKDEVFARNNKEVLLKNY